MAIWTEDDFNNLKAAFQELAEGNSVVQVSIGGKFVRYREAQIPAIERLLERMARDLGFYVSRTFAKPKSRFF